MRIGLAIETATHLALALTTRVAVAFPVLLVFGVHEAVWGTTVITVRQKAVPAEFGGRVGSVYQLALVAELAVGAVLGGLIARVWGITGPFWFAFGGSTVLVAVLWRRLDALAGGRQFGPQRA